MRKTSIHLPTLPNVQTIQITNNSVGFVADVFIGNDLFASASLDEGEFWSASFPGSYLDVRIEFIAIGGGGPNDVAQASANYFVRDVPDGSEVGPIICQRSFTFTSNNLDNLFTCGDTKN
ncbi:MAG: hypothetical protein AAF573_06180 [Bacteroidota bacterium]